MHQLRNVSRWLNAVSVKADASQIQVLVELPFASRLDVVRRYRSIGEDLTLPAVASRSRTDASDIAPIDYGSSLDQLEQIQVPALHERGFRGEGIIVAVFDTGR